MAAWFNANLCAYCAGSSGIEGFVDEHLTREWKSVLPGCPTCRADGALPIARTKRRNGGAIQRSDRHAYLILEEVQEVVMEEGANGVVVPNVVVPPTRACVARRGRRRH